ncbi:MAG TPA: heme ABC exporter ATP-binding protein CcmA [Thermoanaerobaculia bacterium]|nr:heme ABC exporter ATP-binding protein CcmA [Thermoanaerobaculia bacterium]
MSPPAVSTRGLGRRFGRCWALAHVDLEVAAGDLVLLAGANGSGKTTLLRLIAGLLRPSAGSLRVFGLDPVAEPLAVRRRLSVVGHQPFLYGELSARETLALWNRLLERPWPAATIPELLEAVGLEDAASREVRTFSAGMRKRLSLARVRLERPRLLLLDEPFAALDQDGQDLVDRWISEFRDDGGAVVMASHDLSRASGHGARAVLLRSGQAVWTGAARDLGERLRMPN